MSTIISTLRTAQSTVIRLPRLGDNPKTPYMHLVTATAYAVSYMDTCREYGIDPVTGRVVNDYMTMRPDKLIEGRENLCGMRNTVVLRLARAMSAVNGTLRRNQPTLYPEGLVSVPYIVAHPSDEDVATVLNLARCIAKAWFHDEYSSAGTTRLDRRYF